MYFLLLLIVIEQSYVVLLMSLAAFVMDNAVHASGTTSSSFSILGPAGSSYHRKDLAIVLDSSTSIKQDVYESSIGFIYDLVDYMSISPSTTRLALITFASKSTQKFSFEKCVNRECIHKKLLSLIKRRKKGNTNIDAALRSAIGLFTNHRGFAKDKEIYLISDGKWNKGKDPQKSLKKLKKLGIKIIVFGIGANPNREDLEDIAGTSCKQCYHKLNTNDESQKRLMRILTRQKEAVVKCRGRGIVYDECDRQCTCVNGRMTECFRVRKEFTTLSNEEKRRYLQAYYKITTEEPLKSRFVKFISKHAKWFWKGIHDKDQFYPWHRWFIYEFENLMREADCRVTIPFWDWSYWSKNPWKIGLHIWRDDEFGLGGNGVRSKEYCVQTGPFNASSWTHPAPEKTIEVVQSSDAQLGICNTRKYRGHHKSCLRRSFNNLPANLALILKTISTPCNQFGKFDRKVREDFHNDIHNEIGGEMSTDYAANTPEFFLHHSFLDNIWWRWQEKSEQCKYAHYGNRHLKLIDAPYVSTDFIESSNQGECVKVRYDDFLGRVLKPGEDLGKERASTSPEQSCPELDSDSGGSVPLSAFTLLKDRMEREREDDVRHKDDM